MRTLIKNGQLLDIKNGFDRKKMDILVEDGIIKQICEKINEEDCKVLDMEGKIISPGFIDIHVHCFPHNTAISSNPDDIGIRKGVTSIIDAGTSGANTIKDFYENFITKTKTRIFVNLNIASDGLKTLSELSDMNNIEEEKIKEAIKKYPDVIVGLKARASGSVVKENGIKPIAEGKRIASKYGLPVLVHIGNAPPKIEEVLNLLGKGDIVTHCYHNKVTALVRNKEIIPEAKEARKRGVLFDVGHGSESFSFDTAKEGLELGFEADIISTDLYGRNMVSPVGSLENTINKMFYLGVPLERCIEKVTNTPAKAFGIKNLGELKEGYFGDLTIFDLVENGNLELTDSVKKTVVSKKYIKTKYIFIKDELINI